MASLLKLGLLQGGTTPHGNKARVSEENLEMYMRIVSLDMSLH